LVWKTGHNHAGSVGKQVNTYPVTGLDCSEQTRVCLGGNRW
jgi:hypothetical protein